MQTQQFRGAPMGQPNYCEGPADAPRKFWLRRIRINSQGYDKHGTYWGIGAPLYHAETVSTDNEAWQFFRAANREAAKVAIVAKFPNASFFR